MNQGDSSNISRLWIDKKLGRLWVLFVVSFLEEIVKGGYIHRSNGIASPLFPKKRKGTGGLLIRQQRENVPFVGLIRGGAIFLGTL